MPCACVYDDKKIWGKQLWSILHYLPVRLNCLHKVPRVIDFIKNFYLALPCEECHRHCKDYMLNNPIVLTNPNNINACKRDIAKFLYDFHNHVNFFTHKNAFMNFDDYQQIQLSQPDLNEVRKVFENATNKTFFNRFLSPTQKQFGNSFISTYISFG